MPLEEANEVITEIHGLIWEDRLWQKFLVEQPQNENFSAYVDRNMGRSGSKANKAINKVKASEAATRAAQFFNGGE